MEIELIRNDENQVVRILVIIPDLLTEVQAGQEARFRAQRYGDSSLAWDLTGTVDSDGYAVFDMDAVLGQAGEFVGVISVQFSNGSWLTMPEGISIKILEDPPRG